MENKINKINVKSFRGLLDLELNDLKRINVLVGDNNSGKTSFLECLKLISNPTISNAITMCTTRVKQLRMGSFFTEFVHMLPKEKKGLGINISCEFASGNSFKYSLYGNVIQTIANPKEFDFLIKQFGMNPIQNINQFNGKLSYELSNPSLKDIKKNEQEIKINPFNAPNYRTVRVKENLAKVVYISPVDYAGINVLFGNIVKNENYKKIVIEALKMFDPYIEDVLYIKDDLGDTIECIKNSRIGIIPLSCYGDGVKKILSIAGGIAAANNGILLIDEFETAIHIKNYDDVFNFVTKACEEFNVQLFITTHSIEAVDELLKIDTLVENSDINFITLRKDFELNKTVARTLSAKEVRKNRENFDFEVRI